MLFILSAKILNIIFYFQQVVSDTMMEELKECFMEAYDDNKDGKIEIREVNTYYIL